MPNYWFIHSEWFITRREITKMKLDQRVTWMCLHLKLCPEAELEPGWIRAEQQHGAAPAFPVQPGPSSPPAHGHDTLERQEGPVH